MNNTSAQKEHLYYSFRRLSNYFHIKLKMPRIPFLIYDRGKSKKVRGKDQQRLYGGIIDIIGIAIVFVTASRRSRRNEW